jgi:hypothetical protein
MRYLLGIYRTYRSGRHIHVIHHVYTMYIIYIYNIHLTCIYNHTKYKSAATIRFHVTSVCTMYIPCIYQTYTCMYNWYCMYLLFSGLRGSYQPSAPPTHGLEDNVPVGNDELEADFDIPDTQAVLERFMTHMSKLADVEYRVQGPGELRCKDLVSHCCHTVSIYLLHALHIPCIYHVYQIILNSIYRKFNWIYIVYTKYISSILCV